MEMNDESSSAKDSAAADDQTSIAPTQEKSFRYVADRPPTMGRGIGSDAAETRKSGTFVPHRCTPQQLQEEVFNIFQLEQLASGIVPTTIEHATASATTSSMQASSSAVAATMAPSIRDYVNYGAEDEDSVRRNRTGFARFALRPRILQNVSTVNTCTTILQGRVRLSMPLCVAPFAGCSTIHSAEGGELVIARAAVKAGIVYTVPNFSGTPVRDLVDQRRRRHLDKDITQEQPAPFFFQVYPQKPKSSNEGIDRQHMEALLQYLASLGDNNDNPPIVGIIVTCDTPNNGNREVTYKNSKWLQALDQEVGGFPEACALQGATNLPPTV